MEKWMQQCRNKIWFGILFSAVLLCSINSFAGSIFMKNGYIIQGTISKLIKNPMTNRVESVVVNFGNGEVKIYSRFIETWVLNSAEETKLNKKKQVENVKESNGQFSRRPVISVKELELPGFSNFSLKKRQQTSHGKQGLSVDSKKINEIGWKTGAVSGINPFDMVERKSVELGEKQEIYSGLHGSLPRGWALKRQDSSWVMEGPSPAGFNVIPRIAGKIFSGKLSRESQIKFTKKELKKIFSNWRIVDEGYCEIGFKEGYEIYSQGEYNQTSCNIRQIIAWNQKTTWLFSCVWPAKSKIGSQIEVSLQSFDFVAEKDIRK